MTLEEITRRLREWQKAMQSTEKAFSDLSAVVGCRPEAPLFTTITAMQELATRQLSELLGDTDEWLEIWWLENAFGEKPLKVQLPGEDWREIVTIEDLAQLIFDDLALSKKESA